MIDVTYKKLDERYGEVTAEKLAAMSTAERQEYYGALYQYVGYLIGILHSVAPNKGESDSYPTLSSAEYFVLSAAGNAYATLLDSLAALSDLTEEHDDEPA